MQMQTSVPKRKILYICPLARYPGHRLGFVLTETATLSEIGFSVTLLTFKGLQTD
jgi:hypothetical protein